MKAKVSFQMSDVQHKEWFIAALLPQFWIMFTQQKIVSQTEDMEIEMKLESSPIGEIGAGMMQIQSQLANLTLQLQDIKKGKKSKKKYGVPDVELRDTIRIIARRLWTMLHQEHWI